MLQLHEKNRFSETISTGETNVFEKRNCVSQKANLELSTVSIVSVYFYPA